MNSWIKGDNSHWSCDYTNNFIPSSCNLPIFSASGFVIECPTGRHYWLISNALSHEPNANISPHHSSNQAWSNPLTLYEFSLLAISIRETQGAFHLLWPALRIIQSIKFSQGNLKILITLPLVFSWDAKRPMASSISLFHTLTLAMCIGIFAHYYYYYLLIYSFTCAF